MEWSCANAPGFFLERRWQRLLSLGQAMAAQPMITGGLTSQPIGHYEFCKANPGRMLDPQPRHAARNT